MREEKEENTRQMKLKKNNEVEKSYIIKRKKKVEKYRNASQARVKGKKTEKFQIEKGSETNNYLTIWDLLVNINIEEVEHMCKNIKNAKVDRIKRSKYKALAIIYAEGIKEENIPWALPVGTHKLARVFKSNKDYRLQDQHSQFISKLLELSGNASEVLLL